ncbi:hypothetical protein BLTE_12930 [Blastochloris tepida]|uniref:Uncharacterized protein n=1 Tax=Blastochloris tepida TaxID=2233851 RepID=A0A348FZ75_9HYPH|nr:hypothetical protein BLTE_12930 [Blastochloris tepida]
MLGDDARFVDRLDKNIRFEHGLFPRSTLGKTENRFCDRERDNSSEQRPSPPTREPSQQKVPGQTPPNGSRQRGAFIAGGSGCRWQAERASGQFLVSGFAARPSKKPPTPDPSPPLAKLAGGGEKKARLLPSPHERSEWWGGVGGGGCAEYPDARRPEHSPQNRAPVLRKRIRQTKDLERPI